MKRLSIEPDAHVDLRAACDWYGDEGDALRRRFVVAVDEAIAKARERPASFPFVHSLTRRVRVDRFPYIVLFQDKPDTTVVLGVMHAAMDPERHLRRSR